jgi:hypothetical protein
MRDAIGFAPLELQRKWRAIAAARIDGRARQAEPEPHPDASSTPATARNPRIAAALFAVVLLALLAIFLVPRGLEAQALLAIEDDPARIAARAVDENFNANFAEREIRAALADNDADLARSFADLAASRGIALDPALTGEIDAAVADANSAENAMKSFAYGFATGKPDDGAALAGTAVGDLFAFGDIRDAVREGGNLALGRPADELVLGLACVGLAITAGTYAMAGTAAPVRVGLSLAKAARKTGRLGGNLVVTMGRTLRNVVDWNRLKTAIAGMAVTRPVVAVRAARATVKMRGARRLLRLADDVGTVQAKAGTRAALDGLRMAETPREMSRIARLAEKEGSRTRAILKLAGRGAIALSVATFNLGVWIVGAAFAVLALVSSIKSATERVTMRVIRGRKKRRRERENAHSAAMAACK